MKFCMVTSYFGEYSSGGDSIYIERLYQALLNYGHEVHVAYSVRRLEASGEKHHCVSMKHLEI
jgi:hypothetical protein